MLFFPVKHEYYAPSNCEFVAAGEDWEPINPEVEHADCTILTMHAAWLAGELGQSIPYAKVVGGAGAFFREQVGSLASQVYS